MIINIVFVTIGFLMKPYSRMSDDGMVVTCDYGVRCHWLLTWDVLKVMNERVMRRESKEKSKKVDKRQYCEISSHNTEKRKDDGQ